jgi:hypothetical protein
MSGASSSAQRSAVAALLAHDEKLNDLRPSQLFASDPPERSGFSAGWAKAPPR